MLWQLPFLPVQASTFAGRVDTLFLFLVALTIVVSGGVAGLEFYFAVKYRRRTPDEVPPQVHGSMKLEVIWTVIPFIVAMGIFVWGASVYFTLYRAPKEALEIYVTGKQWMWRFQHPDGQREINELHVPVGRRVKLLMASEDVIHAFYVPAFRIKNDVVPGRYTTTWFEATKSGPFDLYCAEYCGTNHSGMIGKVHVMEPAEYQAWLSGGAVEGSLASRGEKLFQEQACITCHRADAQGRGPLLNGLFGSRVALQGGATVIADEAYIRESIVNPQAKIVAGFQPLMPTFQGRFTEERMLELIAYIKSLGAPPQAGTSGAGAQGAASGVATPRPSQTPK